MRFVVRVECEICGQWVGNKVMFGSGNVLPHWVNCLNSKMRSLEIDVSYIYNADG